MAEIINLNRARKARDKAASKREAQSNRIAFGRTKQEREAAAVTDLRAKTHLDGHRLED